ncbi:STAS domain-containing protein [Actinosynnema sp. CA-299493]
MSFKRLGSASVLVVRGCVDAGTAHVLRERLDSAAGVSDDVVVDLSDVSFFSSAGVAALVAASREVGLHVVVTPVVRRVLAAAGVADSLRLHDFPAEAEEAATAGSSRHLLLVG